MLHSWGSNAKSLSLQPLLKSVTALPLLFDAEINIPLYMQINFHVRYPPKFVIFGSCLPSSKVEETSILNFLSLDVSILKFLLYFFPGLFFIIFFLFWLIYGGLGFGVLGLGSYIGFLGLGISVDGVWGLWCEAIWVFRVGALYININE